LIRRPPQHWSLEEKHAAVFLHATIPLAKLLAHHHNAVHQRRGLDKAEPPSAAEYRMRDLAGDHSEKITKSYMRPSLLFLARLLPDDDNPKLWVQRARQGTKLGAVWKCLCCPSTFVWINKTLHNHYEKFHAGMLAQLRRTNPEAVAEINQSRSLGGPAPSGPALAQFVTLLVPEQGIEQEIELQPLLPRPLPLSPPGWDPTCYKPSKSRRKKR
jgi:hypothetical protein